MFACHYFEATILQRDQRWLRSPLLQRNLDKRSSHGQRMDEEVGLYSFPWSIVESWIKIAPRSPFQFSRHFAWLLSMCWFHLAQGIICFSVVCPKSLALLDGVPNGRHWLGSCWSRAYVVMLDDLGAAWSAY